MEPFLKLIKLSLLLIKVLDESSSSLLHFVEPTFKSLNNACHRTLNLSSILRVPDIVSNELFDGFLPALLQKDFVTHNLELVHQTVDVLNENIVTGDENLLLLLALSVLRQLSLI